LGETRGLDLLKKLKRLQLLRPADLPALVLPLRHPGLLGPEDLDARTSGAATTASTLMAVMPASFIG
jgi:hypothetical protein